MYFSVSLSRLNSDSHLPVIFTLFLFSIIFSTSIQAEGEAPQLESSQEARKLLEQMSAATHRLNFDGVFVYHRGTQLDSMRIIHKVDENGETERLISLTGAAREVLRDKDEVTCVFPDNQSVMVDRGRNSQLLSANLSDSVGKISQYYQFSIIGEDRVVGRPTKIVQILPNENDRYGYRLWVDNETFLMLRSAIVDTHGKVMEQVLFTQIEIPEQIPAGMMKSVMETQNYTRYTNDHQSDLSLVQPASDWEIKWLPTGFTMEDHNVKPVTNDQSPVNHLIYSDGLATVSIFIEKTKANKEAVGGYVSMGAVNAFSTSHNGYQMTAVGEIPPATVRKIASSIVHNP